MSKKNNDKNKMYILLIMATILILAVIAVCAYLYTIENKTNKEEKEVSYTELIKDINDEKIEKIEMTVGSTTIKVKYKDIEKEKTAIIPSTQPFIEFIQEKVDSDIELIQNPKSVVYSILNTFLSLLPTMIMVALFIMVFKMQGLGDKGKVYDGETNKTDVKFDDVAGLDEEKEELKEIVDFLKEPRKFETMGAKIPRGILLYGKPGTGKTLIAKAIAGEANVPFISMSGSEFIEIIV